MKSNRVRAFTLIEIIVTVAIIGLLATLFITNAESMFGQSQSTVARVFVRDSMKTALVRYKIDMGAYPSTAEGLAALVTAPEKNASFWRGPYVDLNGDRLPLDPWNEPYQYTHPGKKNPNGYDLFSKGPDKTAGTSDDIGNW